jgi:phosphopentomutase
MRAFLIILDSVGIGEAPDAADFGDAGAATLPHLAEAAAGLHAPALQRLGLGNIPGLLSKGLPITGVPPEPAPLASFGALQERSRGKDTTTGHWELAGLLLDHPFHLFPSGPPSFPADLVQAFEQGTGRRLIGNRAASGTAIIQELGEQHLREGAFIAYTSADSVFQIAAHTDIVPLPELYRACELARKLLNPLHVGRVIARPFRGKPGAFERTPDRRDFSFPLPEPTVLDSLVEAGHAVTLVGKLEDIFARRGYTQSFHTTDNASSQARLLALSRDQPDGLVMANLIDFDMLYGHRRDARGYAAALEQTDVFLAEFMTRLGPDDVLILTADHGNDPTFHGTDHTREYVPLLVFQHGRPDRSLGIRQGFYDVAQSLAAFFKIPPMPRGISFL